MKVVFLGGNHNILSLACLRGLLESGAKDILVGIDAVLRKGMMQTAMRGFRLYGARLFAGRALMLALPILLPGIRMNYGYGASLQEVARRKGIPWFECTDVNGSRELQTITEFSPDLIVVANFGQILRQQALMTPSKGCINVHPSLLPKYRGPLPLFWALKNKERTTGVSIHYMDEGIDSGDIIVQRPFSIGRWETESSLRRKAAELSVPLVVQTVDLIRRGGGPRVPQTASDATYYSYPRHGKRDLARGPGQR